MYQLLYMYADRIRVSDLIYYIGNILRLFILQHSVKLECDFSTFLSLTISLNKIYGMKVCRRGLGWYVLFGLGISSTASSPFAEMKQVSTSLLPVPAVFSWVLGHNFDY
jgi:hypothetical protein